MEDTQYQIVIVFLMIALLITVYKLMTKETFCNCQGMNNQVCPDKQLLKDLYNSGELTENTDLIRLPK